MFLIIIIIMVIIIIIIKFNVHIRQGKVYLAAVGLNVPTSHWIRSILGSLCVLNNNNNK